MHAKVVRIHWHDKKPVFSADFDPRDPDHLLTAGGDNNIRAWRLKRALDEPDGTAMQYCATLTRHLRSVNCVRYSHSGMQLRVGLGQQTNRICVGEMVASAGDGGTVLIWRQIAAPPSRPQNRAIFGADADDVADEDDTTLEHWTVNATLRTADAEDIYDLAWSPDDKFILVGLTDNSAQLWDLSANKCIKIMRDHSHFIQGVAWDPWGRYLVTESADRSVKIWQLSTKKSGATMVTALSKVSKASSAIANDVKSCYLFHDETLVTFFRRPAFSPDGSLLLLPTGLHQGQNCLHILTRNSLATGFPVAHIKGFDRAVLGVRFNGRLFRHFRDNGREGTPWKLSYRMVYAVFTMDTLYVFDTHQMAPIAVFRDLHYGSLTDVTWSADGHTLLMTATDGFCSIVTFAVSDLGPIFEPEEEQRILYSIKERLGGSAVRDIPMTPIDEPSSCLPTSDPGPVEADTTPMDDLDLPPSALEREPDGSDAAPSHELAPQNSGKRRIQPTFLQSL